MRLQANYRILWAQAGNDLEVGSGAEKAGLEMEKGGRGGGQNGAEAGH